MSSSGVFCHFGLGRYLAWPNHRVSVFRIFARFWGQPEQAVSNPDDEMAGTEIISIGVLESALRGGRARLHIHLVYFSHCSGSDALNANGKNSLSAASGIESSQILGRVITQAVDLKTLDAPTRLATPAVSPLDLAAELAISSRIKPR